MGFSKYHYLGRDQHPCSQLEEMVEHLESYSNQCTLETAHVIIKYRNTMNILRRWKTMSTVDFAMERKLLMEEYKIPEITKGDKYESSSY